MGKSSVSSGVYPTILFVIVILCVVATAVFYPRVVEGFNNCPQASDPFSTKLFIDREDCYAGTGPDCEDVMVGMFGENYEYQFPGTDPEDVKQAVRLMANNRYRKKNSGDDGQVYSLNECVIPDYDGNNLKLTNCLLNNNIRLEPSSTAARKNDQVEWDHTGCVVTENNLRNFGPIAREIAAFFSEPKDNLENGVTRGIAENQRKTQQFNAEYNSAQAAEVEANRQRVEAIYAVMDTEQRREESKYMELGYNKKRSEYLDRINKLARSGGSRDGVGPGFFYRVYRGYFASFQGSETLNLFRNTFPYECGIASVINDFAGMRGYPQGKMTQRVSVQVTGIFYPPVSGTWRFELTSDDSSYMWVEGMSTKYDNMEPASALIKNPGWHGDVSVQGAIQLVGLDSGQSTQGYKIKIVQGNDGGPGTLRVRMLRPGSSTWEVFGNSDIEVMFFRELNPGLMAKVTRGYYYSVMNAIRAPNDPLVAWPIDEVYQLPRQYWNPNFGITGKAKYESFKRIQYTDASTLQNRSAYEKEHGFNGNHWAFAYHDQRNINIYGLFYPPIAGRYTFYLAADDAAYLWVNDSAINFQVGNALINNGGEHGTIMKKVDYTVGPSMVGKPMPIRVVQGDWGGGNTLVFAYRKPGDTDATFDLTKDFKY